MTTVEPEEAMLEEAVAQEEGPHSLWHWPKKDPWEARSTVAQKIEDLVWEAMDSLYQLHWTNAHQLYGSRDIGPGGWAGMGTERRNLLDVAKRNTGATEYGVTFDYARWTWEHVERAPASLTDLGAEELNDEHPNPCPRCVREGTEATCRQHVFKRGEREYACYEKQGTLEELRQRWTSRYVAKVQQVLSACTDEETRFHLATLTGRLGSFEIGTAEGASVTERLSREVKGREVLRFLSEYRNGLLRRLQEISPPLRVVSNGPMREQGVSPETAVPTFGSLLGDENLKVVLAAIHDLGFRVTPTKGKAQIIAAMEAALEHFGVKVPQAKYWPGMLNDLFPGIEAGEKAVPPARTTQRTAAYRDARTAMLDRLKK